MNKAVFLTNILGSIWKEGMMKKLQQISFFVSMSLLF